MPKVVFDKENQKWNVCKTVTSLLSAAKKNFLN